MLVEVRVQIQIPLLWEWRSFLWWKLYDILEKRQELAHGYRQRRILGALIRADVPFFLIRIIIGDARVLVTLPSLIFIRVWLGLDWTTIAISLPLIATLCRLRFGFWKPNLYNSYSFLLHDSSIRSSSSRFDGLFSSPERLAALKRSTHLK